MNKRRTLIKAIAGSPLIVGCYNNLIESTNVEKRRVACQQYSWFTFYNRDGKVWGEDLNASYNDLIKAGFKGFEPIFESAKNAEESAVVLKQKKIQSHSLYVNSTLHESAKVEDSITQVLNIAKVAKSMGVKIMVTNPSPINWNSNDDKTDQQLKTQAIALNRLGKSLRDMGITLAYHSHATEMRHSAREFHHMMNGTDTQNVKLCLDSHWIYRGSGNSQVALFDIVNLYIDRIVELHVRQSKNGIFTEEFCEGDIDYRHLAKLLYANNTMPHLVLEQFIEEDSPKTMDGIKAHQLGMEYLKDVFVDLIA